MHISKEGDPYLRTLLVQGAQHILGPFGSQTLGTEAGRAWWKEWKEASHCGHGKKAGGAAASPMGEWRSVRTIAQQQPHDGCGSRVRSKRKTKSKSFWEEKRQKPKPSSGDCVNRLAQVPLCKSTTTGRQTDGSTG
jgi:hypothetical protein